MTVEQLIEVLRDIEDKNKRVYLYGEGIDYEIEQCDIKEFDESVYIDIGF